MNNSSPNHIGSAKILVSDVFNGVVFFSFFGPPLGGLVYVTCAFCGQIVGWLMQGQSIHFGATLGMFYTAPFFGYLLGLVPAAVTGLGAGLARRVRGKSVESLVGVFSAACSVAYFAKSGEAYATEKLVGICVAAFLASFVLARIFCNPAEVQLAVQRDGPASSGSAR